MSWKYKITILYLGFVGVILAGVIGATMQDFELVRPDYYDAEIAYQDRIDEQHNVARLKEKPLIAHNEHEISLMFPASLAAARGTVTLYRPSDAQLDQSFALQLQDNRQRIPTAPLRPGRWTLQMEYEVENVRYYQEQELLIY